MSGERGPSHRRSTLRPPESAAAEEAVRSFEAAGGDLTHAQVRELIGAVGEHAPALLPLCLGDTTLLRDVLVRPLERAEKAAAVLARFLDATRGLEDGPALRRVLRRLRHRGVVRIAMREAMRFADVDQTAGEMSDLASACVEAALRGALRTVDALHGLPRDAQGRAVPIAVLGMGKLGGHELNLGSDIDICFFYGPTDAEAEGDDLEVVELYSKVATRAARILADVTEDGFCFRVDLRLRPGGSQGPIITSLAAAERYYETLGRTWERAALVRARPIAGDLGFGRALLDALRPFVYRREVDPGIAREMMALVERSRRQLRGDPSRDLKLSEGGIREAEFFIQSLQLIWGGRYPELREPSTTLALRRLRAAGLVGHQEAMDFGADWALLRRVEHRLHVSVGHQTHDLPGSEETLDRLGRSLGLASGEALRAAVDAARGRMAALFRSLSEGGEEPANPLLVDLLDRVAAGASTAELVAAIETCLPVNDPFAAAAHLRRLAKRPADPLSEQGQRRTPTLGPLLLEEVRQAAHPDSALGFLADLFSHLAGEWSYDKLLASEPMLARRLIGLFGANRSISESLVQHPETIDELLALRGGAPSIREIEELHAEGPLVPDILEDGERFIAALRRTKRELFVRVGLSYVAEEIDSERFLALLSALAEAQVRAALRYAERDATARYGRPRADPGATLPADLLVVAMGKFGGAELGFGGDLDLLFLYGADGRTDGGSGGSLTHDEYFARIAQRLMRVLTQPDAEGTPYEVDTRLRPNGRSGPLVLSLPAFIRYHETRSLPWERQALVRARVIAGDPALTAEAVQAIDAIAFEGTPITVEALAQTRGRMQRELAQERADRFHAKLGYGALTDIEFIVQLLQMRHGADPSVREQNTRRALAALRQGGYLDEPEAEALEDARAFFRRIEQTLKLLDERRDVFLVRGGPIADRVARRLRLRDRDGLPPAEVLFEGWIRRATEVRAIFESLVAPVGEAAPWAPRH